MTAKQIQEALEKFAVSGGMYARALTNAAQRSGGRIGQPALGAIAAQPRAQMAPGFAEKARAPGALQPTAGQQANQKMLAPVDFAGHEYHEDAIYGGKQTPAQLAARQHFDQRLQQFGKTVQAPGTNAAIAAEFRPSRPTGMPEAPATRVQEATELPGASTATRVQGAPGRSDTVTQRDVGPAFEPTQLAPRAAGPALHLGRPTTQVGAWGGALTEGTQAGRKYAFNLGQAAAKAAPYALGAGIPLATAGGLMLSKPAIQSNLKNLMEDKGTIQEKDLAGDIPEPAMQTASQVQKILTERGIDPSALRIAVDAPPGSGKTTLSRALSQQLGVKHYGLDWLPHNKWHSVMGGGHLEKMPRAPRAGEILEHYNLLRSYDPEMFDAVFHIQKDPETIKKQITQRGRSAGVSTFLDYDKSLAVGRLAYDSLAGDSIDLGNGTMMKLRPHEGWGGAQIDAQLQQMGIDPSKLSRHQKLLSLHAGKKQTGAGWTPYFKNPFSPGETAAVAASVPLGIGAALAAKKYLRR